MTHSEEITETSDSVRKNLVMKAEFEESRVLFQFYSCQEGGFRGTREPPLDSPLRMTYMNQKGAEKVAVGKTVNGDKLKKIYGNNRAMVCVHSLRLVKGSAA